MILFTIYCLIAVAAMVSSWYLAVILAKAIFSLDEIDSVTAWKIVGLLFIPLVGIFFAGRLFIQTVNKSRGLSLEKTCSMFLLCILIGAATSAGFSLSSRLVISPFRVSGNSMAPATPGGSYLLVNKIDRDFQRGEIVVFSPHTPNNKTYYIKRVIALPGDRIRLEDGAVFLRKAGESGYAKLEESYLPEALRWKTFLPSNAEEAEFLVPAGKFFMLWDNREASSDSRSCFMSCETPGASPFIRQSDISGKVIGH